METISRRKALAGICSLTGSSLFIGSGCAVNPVTGKSQFMLMSESKEIAMGQQAHGEIVQSYGSYGDSTIQSWFNDRGQEMAHITHRPNLPYNFTVLDSPIINAFAVPGGYVYVTRGILAYFNDEAQFAGVLGHELGHVNARHTAARYSKAQLANLTLGIGTIFSEEFARYAQIASLGTSLLFLKFSRDDEREADKLGVEYSSADGYDAVHMSEFFHTLERMHPSGGSLPAWQSTHPDPGDRINATKKMALAYQSKYPDKKFIIRKNEYYDLIDGIVFGDDPRQGYVKDNMFYHPGMKFMFPVPSGWSVSNQPSEVRMSPESEKSILIFNAGSGDTPRNAATKFAEGNEITVTNTVDLQINGMSATQTTGQMASGEDTLAVISYFIKNNDMIYAFHGLSAEADVATFSTVYRTTATGFNKLTNKNYLDVKPKTIEVRTVSGQKSLRNVLNGFGVPEDQLETIAILNGMEPDDSLPSGTRVKVSS
ncbi:MAG: M48 family metalloprotease [Candidatus Latescibacteria bacterium]|nr:M48 family metalloprotease [Candidatus Latescibacterota bacterium]